MKEILLSIKPEWVAKILNGEKTIEIRKTFPKCELPVKVYIYCTKGNENLYLPQEHDCWEYDEASALYLAKEPLIREDIKLNGKVVAKFTLNKVVDYEECSMLFTQNSIYEINVREQGNVYYRCEYIGELQSDNLDGLLEKSCLTNEELEKYIGIETSVFYAWHIDDLDIFDEPKELKDFDLTKAPQSWRYIDKTTTNAKKYKKEDL